MRVIGILDTLSDFVSLKAVVNFLYSPSGIVP